ncbi:MAG: SRPBCC domain-containing protein [Dehalococcoidia bacterium]
MKRIETSIEMRATPEQLWEVLMDFPSYPSWNPMVVGIAGEARPGQRLEVEIAMKGGRTMKFEPTVVEYEPGHRFGWLGKFWLRGLFDGLHRFEVQPASSGATFVHSEEFRGLLPPFLGKVLRDTHDSVVAMNEALAVEVARRVAAPDGSA